MEAAGHAVAIVQGSPINFKITTKEDFDLAEAILKSRSVKSAVPPAARFDDEAKW